MNEQCLQLLLRHPEKQAEAQRIVRQSNKELRHFIGQLKSTNWSNKTGEAELKALCREAELCSTMLLKRVQAVFIEAQESTSTDLDSL
ncbi:MAG: hypothetical protein O2818_02330 [Bacteroidetes bacterium]|nr:hypothetical protein [Bacteroidota bacterium]